MDCGQIPQIDYGKFSAALHARAVSETATLPINGTLEITARCNLRCAHCYLPMAHRQGERGGGTTATTEGLAQEIPSLAEAASGRLPLCSAEACRLLDEVADEGCLWLLITGGEPLIRPDFLEIYDYAKRKGFLITLFTNATLVTERIADYLAEYPPFSVEVSLYGATATTYETVTGVTSSYERCLRGIDLLVSRHIPLRLKTMVLRANVHELGLMEEFASRRGLSFRWDHQVHPQLDGCLDPVRVRLTPEEMVAVDLAFPRRVEGWRDLIERTRDLRIEGRVFNCGAGFGSFHIDAFGYLQPCGFVRRYSYDLRQGSFHDGYHRFFPDVRSLRLETTTLCASCSPVNVCGICPAWQDMEGNGRKGPIEHIHRYARLLAAAVCPEANRVGAGLRREEVVAKGSGQYDEGDLPVLPISARTCTP